MSARRKRPVLYEIVQRTQRHKAQGWRGRLQSAKPDQADETNEGPVPGGGAVSTDAHPESSTPAPPGGRPIRIVGQQLHLTLGWTSAAAACIALVFLLWVAYEAGQRSVAVPAQPDERGVTAGGDARRGPEPNERSGVAGYVALPDRAPRAQPPAETADEPPPASANRAEDVLQRDMYYVTAQYFRRSRTDHAEAAARYLIQNGVPAVLQHRRADIALIINQAFSTANDPGIARLRATLRELGKGFDGYDFAQSEVHKY